MNELLKLGKTKSKKMTRGSKKEEHNCLGLNKGIGFG